MKTSVKYPEINVNVLEEDGDGILILEKVSHALSEHGVEDSEIKTFRLDAISGDYEHLEYVVEQWVQLSRWKLSAK